jgi:predicted nucleic acid-binding protein
MKLTNQTMDDYLRALQAISSKVTGRFGYAVARNMRNLSNELVEYRTLKDNTIKAFGVINEQGNYQIEIGTEAFEKYIEEMKQYTNIEHDVQFMLIGQDELLKSPLNANEILSVDFMVKEETDE